MANFDKPLPTYTEEELFQRMDNWDPKYGALAAHELQRLQRVASEADARRVLVEHEFCRLTAEAAAERLAAKNEAMHAAAATAAELLAFENKVRYAAAVADAKLLVAQNETAMAVKEQQQLRSTMGNVVSTSVCLCAEYVGEVAHCIAVGPL